MRVDARGEGRDTVIFYIEDTAEINRQVQETKLASLSRLTASTAHEIRNPLGAISHTAQLLGESPSRSRGSAYDGHDPGAAQAYERDHPRRTAPLPQGTAQSRTYFAQDLAHAIQRSIQP
jgi:signal transduction histidine kinase